MSDDGALMALAARHGIEHGYHDIWGTWHALAPHTARALLAAMGVAAGDDGAVHAALRDADERARGALAPPVTVSREGGEIRIALNPQALPAHVAPRWSLELEDGRTLEGSCHGHELALPGDIPTGYHRLVLRCGDRESRTAVIHAPARCVPVPPGRGGGRAWGIALQLYGLRSRRNWGVGDFGDLLLAIDTLAELGADMVGLNPLHALYPDSPGHASPYSPSSRTFLNPAYLHVEAMEDFQECAPVRDSVAAEPFQRRLESLRNGELVDYERALPVKFQVLRDLFGHFQREHLAVDSPRARAFARFVDESGQALVRHAVFQCLHEAMGAAGLAPWPEDYLDPGSAAVAGFAAAHRDEVAFHQYLQWNVRSQLEHAAAHARARGMSIGLYLDLAVGSDSHGADAWADPALHACGVSIGAPPDDFTPMGQVWGLPPWRPDTLRERAYQPFVDCLRASMRGAGAIRIDHVLGLLRQFWVPSGGSAADGAYVRYPVHDLLAVTALESARQGCVVVGEDLGTVPDEIRAALHDNGVLSYRVLYFEKHWRGDQSYREPGQYPAQALVTLSTHDLATLAGFWTGHDLDMRDALGLFPDAALAAGQREGRAHDRHRLLEALARQGLRPGAPETGDHRPGKALIVAVHRFLARTPAALLSVQMEDVLGAVEQANVPGTVAEQPNWRRRLTLPVEAWSGCARLRALAAAVCREREGR